MNSSLLDEEVKLNCLNFELRSYVRKDHDIQSIFFPLDKLNLIVNKNRR